MEKPQPEPPPHSARVPGAPGPGSTAHQAAGRTRAPTAGSPGRGPATQGAERGAGPRSAAVTMARGPRCLRRPLSPSLPRGSRPAGRPDPPPAPRAHCSRDPAVSVEGGRRVRDGTGLRGLGPATESPAARASGSSHPARGRAAGAAAGSAGPALTRGEREGTRLRQKEPDP